MNFRIWHVFIVLLVLGLVTGGIAYAQGPDRRAPGVYPSTGASGSEKFLKLGTTRYGAASATNYVISHGSLDIGPVLEFTVPEGMKADLIATFSGEVANPGPSTDDVCIGVMTVTNEPRQMSPAGGVILFTQSLIHGGATVSTSFQQHIRKVKPGDYAVTFGMTTFDVANNDQCAVGYRTITLIANIY